MATQYDTAQEAVTAHPHEVALPYRGDGVARALREIYCALDDAVPSDMKLLLAMIDEPAVANDPR
jgi:hypothetical protein